MAVHESIATASIKGAIRRSEFRYEEAKEAIEKIYLSKRGKKLTRSDTNGFFQLIADMFGDYSIEQYIKNKKNSWHFLGEIHTIGFSTIDTEHYGKLNHFIVEQFNSRRFVKCHSEARLWYVCYVFFQEHFFIRAIQRLGLKSVGDVGKKVYPIMQWLILENIPFKHLPENPYFVMKECVLVAHRASHNQGIVFKTVLMRDFMNDEQLNLYKRGFDILEKESLEVVMMDEVGSVVRKLPIFEPKQLLLEHSLNNNWLQKDLQNR